MAYFLFPYSPACYFQNYAYTSLDNCSVFVSFLIKYLQGSILEVSCDVYVYQAAQQEIMLAVRVPWPQYLASGIGKCQLQH